MYILGINAYHPDSSACIIKDGQLLAAVEEERFNRIKHWAGLPYESIQYCLKEANLGLEEIDYIAINRNPRANFYKKVIFVASHRPSLSFMRSRLRNVVKIGGIRDILSRKFLSPSKKIKAKVFNIEHHAAHLASVFFVSPYEQSTVVSLDGFGDFTSCMIAKGKENSMDIRFRIHYPHSLGIFYTAFTQFLGFKKFGDEYKVMGLAAYGQPRYLEEIKEIVTLKPKGRYALNLEYFNFCDKKESMLWDNTEPTLSDIFSDKFIEKFGPPRKPNEEISAYFCDLASSLQAMYEKAFFHVLNYAYKITGIPNLCLAGGCALNSLANGKIFDSTPFKQVYIQPGSSDAGGCLGAGYYLYHQILKNKRNFVMERAYWGPGFDNSQVKSGLESRKEELSRASCRIEENNDLDELCKKTAQSISAGKVVGWFQGRMEWGPRALGNRSILVDPRRKEMQDILNERIKRREWFRPFAPAILLEKVGEYFEKDYPDPFMLKVYLIKEDKRALIPAVTHKDGTGRLQTVSQKENPLFWRLIKEFENITGLPVLLNTSFNENEPIVCKPQEAIDCFLRTKMDILVIGNYFITR